MRCPAPFQSAPPAAASSAGCPCHSASSAVQRVRHRGSPFHVAPAAVRIARHGHQLRHGGASLLLSRQCRRPRQQPQHELMMMAFAGVGEGASAVKDSSTSSIVKESSSSSTTTTTNTATTTSGRRVSSVAGFSAALSRSGPEAALKCARALHAQLTEKTNATAEEGDSAPDETSLGRASTLLFRQLYRHHGRFMAACLTTGNMDLALGYMELLPSKARAWSMLLRAALDAGRSGHLQPLAAVRKVVEARGAAGIPEDVWTATALVTAARLQGDFEAAEVMFERSWAKGPGSRNAALGSAMLSVLAARGDAAEAAGELVGRMREAGVALDQTAYGAYLQALEAGDHPELVENALDEMSADGVELNPRLAAAAMKASFACGQRSPDWFFGMFKESMKGSAEGHRAPSEYVLSRLFTSLAGCPQTQQLDVEAAFEIFAAYRATRSIGAAPLHESVYASLLSLLSKRGDPFWVVDTWEDIVEDGAQRRPAVIGAALSCCAASAHPEVQAQAVATQVFAVQDLVWELYDTALAAPGWPKSSQIMLGAAPQHEAFTREVSDGDFSEEQPGNKSSVYTGTSASDRSELLVSFNALLNYCARSGATEEALEILGLMRGTDGPDPDAKPDPDADAAPSLPAPRVAPRAAAAAAASGPAPDVTSFNTVMAGLASSGRHARANFVLAEMRAAGLEPDEITFATLIHACTEANNCRAAEEVILSMPDYNLEPTVTAYTTYMDACLRDGSNSRVSHVFRILEDMKAKGVAPTPVTYMMVLRACVAQRDADKAFAMYEQAAEENLLLNDGCHNLLIKVCTITGRLDDGVELVKEVARHHGGIKGHTFNALIRAISSVSVDRALRLLGLMRAMGLKPSVTTVLDLVDACARDNNAQAAFALYRGLHNINHGIPRSTGSGLVLALCAAGDKENALKVFDGMMTAGGRTAPNDDATGDKKAASGRTGTAGGSAPRRRRLKYHYLPNPVARSSVAYMLAQAGELQKALAVVQDMKSDEGTGGMAKAAAANKEMFQELITGFCRQGRIDDALYVFDEWKGSVVTLPEEKRVGCRLNSAVLAFLEASCRKHEIHQWRVFDVTAIMRQQFETGKQSQLERPQKASHHFNSSLYGDDE